MGGAGIGGGLSNAALSLNPAGMSSGSFYALDLYYFRTSESANLVGVNVVDSQTRYTRDKIALGLGYQADIEGFDAKAHDARVGLSTPLFNLSSALFLGGLSARYVYDERTKRDGFDIDAGVMTRIADLISIGVVGRELLNEDHRRFGAGVGLDTTRLSAHFDYLKTPSLELDALRVGAELMITEQFVIRGGYAQELPKEGEGARLVSGGLSMIGLGGGNGQLSCSYTHDLNDDTSFFGVSLTAYLQMNTQSSEF
jgi:hypothetical protein